MLNANQYQSGDYIISGCPNAFNDKTSYWISKKTTPTRITASQQIPPKKLPSSWPTLRAILHYMKPCMPDSAKINNPM